MIQMADVSADVAGQLLTKQYRAEKIFGKHPSVNPFRAQGSVRLPSGQFWQPLSLSATFQCAGLCGSWRVRLVALARGLSLGLSQGIACC